jgi:UDP-N-acetylmuramoyl-L-alanyl-D-glutamate--2,6-diaminopimelate ligase
LAALRPVTKGRLICVFGAGGNRDRTKRPLMGQAVGQRADVAIVTSDNPRDEEPAAIAADIYRGLRFFADQRQVDVILDRSAAIELALSVARPGDVVLVAGKGHETHQIIGERRLEFDDRQVVKEVLYRSQAASGGFRAAA